MKKIIFGIGIVLFFLVACVASFIVGAFSGETGSGRRRYKTDRVLLERILKDNPEFSGLAIMEYPGGGALLSGQVANDEELQRLNAELRKVFGSSRIDFDYPAYGAQMSNWVRVRERKEIERQKIEQEDDVSEGANP